MNKKDLIKSLKIPEPGSYEELMYSHEEFREMIKPKREIEYHPSFYEWLELIINNAPRKEGMHTIIYEPRQSGRSLVYEFFGTWKRLRDDK